MRGYGFMVVYISNDFAYSHAILQYRAPHDNCDDHYDYDPSCYSSVLVLEASEGF